MPSDSVNTSEHWTEVRIELLALLTSRDADVAHLYRSAIDACIPPLTRASLMITGHCIRELVKVLPVILGYPSTERADTSRSARELSRQWAASGLPLAPDEASDVEAVSIPLTVFSAARDVAIAGSEGGKNSRQLTALIVTGQSGDADSASVRRVHGAIEMFRGLAHARDYTKPERPIPPLDQVVGELEIIEEALMNRLGNMADRASMVRDLLAIANRTLEDVQQ